MSQTYPKSNPAAGLGPPPCVKAAVAIASLVTGTGKGAQSAKAAMAGQSKRP